MAVRLHVHMAFRADAETTAARLRPYLRAALPLLAHLPLQRSPAAVRGRRRGGAVAKSVCSRNTAIDRQRAMEQRQILQLPSYGTP